MTRANIYPFVICRQPFSGPFVSALCVVFFAVFLLLSIRFCTDSRDIRVFARGFVSVLNGFLMVFWCFMRVGFGFWVFVGFCVKEIFFSF